MTRLIKRTVILCKVETTSGVDAAPTGALNAMQVLNMSITPLEAGNVEMKTILPYFGNSPALVGPVSVKIDFTVPLAGSGAAATAPAWGALLVASAHAETLGLTQPNRVEYLPVTDALKTATIYYHDDGVLHKAVGCFGAPSLSAKAGEVPSLRVAFTGLDGGVTAAPNAVATLTAWKTPVAVSLANVVDVTLGCSYAAGALTGGASFNSTGLTLDWGHTVNFVPMLSAERVVLSERAVKGALELELDAAQEVAQLAAVRTNTLQGLGFVIGKLAGSKIMLHLPSVQLTNPKKVERNGMRLIGFDLRALPVAGNDELRIVCL